MKIVLPDFCSFVRSFQWVWWQACSSGWPTSPHPESSPPVRNPDPKTPKLSPKFVRKSIPKRLFQTKFVRFRSKNFRSVSGRRGGKRTRGRCPTRRRSGRGSTCTSGIRRELQWKRIPKQKHKTNICNNC